MGSPANDTDEPLTPAGRLFLQPETNQIIHCVMGLKNPINIDSIKSELRNSPMLKHPRFTSLMVRDYRAIEHWRRTEIDIENHLVIIDDPVSSAADDESVINEYLAELSIDPSGLSTDKPLWEIHLLIAHKCLIFRIHHSLGDGVSLMSLLLACCRRVDDADALPTMVSANSSKSNGRTPTRTRTRWRNLWGFVIMVWFSFIYVLEFTLRSLWLRDRKTPITGGAGVELWPRKLATAGFCLQDMKVVKAVLAHAVSYFFYFGKGRVTYQSTVRFVLFQIVFLMHMVSYAGRADMQILVAKDIIPDPEFLAKCFEDALLEMKAQAMANI